MIVINTPGACCGGRIYITNYFLMSALINYAYKLHLQSTTDINWGI
jgi:hypothetical protein